MLLSFNSVVLFISLYKLGCEKSNCPTHACACPMQGTYNKMTTTKSPSIWNLGFDNMYRIVFILDQKLVSDPYKGCMTLYVQKLHKVNLSGKAPLAFPAGAFPTQKNQRAGYAHLGCLLMIQDHSGLSLHKL